MRGKILLVMFILRSFDNLYFELPNMVNYCLDKILIKYVMKPIEFALETEGCCPLFS